MLFSNPCNRRAHSRAVQLSIPALVVILAATGCVRAKPPGLKISGLESSIVFGLKPVPVVAPPGAAPTPPLEASTQPPGPSDSSLNLPELPPLPTVKPRDLPTKSKPFCRTATTNDFPTVATLGAPNPPTPGFYQFKKTPPELFGSDQYNVTPKDLQTRLIFNVSKPTKTQNPYNGAPAPVGSGQTVITTVYTYAQATYLDSKNAIVDFIKVTDNPITQAVGSNIGPTTYSGQADRGVALIGRQRVQTGSNTGSFFPSSPLLLLPLPAVSGQTWQSVSVDPNNGATYILYGRILNRQRVDACGDVVEGWAVEAQTVFQNPLEASSKNATFRYIVDTKNGGQIIYEKVDPIGAPTNPANGTPLDAAVPASPNLPGNPLAQPALEWSLATRDPKPGP